MDFLEIFGWEQTQLNDLQYVGYSYLKQGKYEIAIKFFEALNMLKPNHDYYLQILGALYLEAKKPKKALEYLDASLKITPNHLPTLLNKVKAFLSIGHKRQALILAKRLKTFNDPFISSQASAIILAYGEL